MRFGLEEHVITKLKEVFEGNSKVDKAIVFGSRAKGNYRPDSDIDIAIKGPDITLDDILKIQVAFEEEHIAKKIDLVHYNTLKEKTLIEHIDRVGVKLYSRWESYFLGEACEIITGFPFKSEEYEANGSLKVVRGENVTIGKLRWDSEKHWNKSTKDLEKYFLAESDIVIGMDGSRVGSNRAIIRKEELPLILAQRVARLRAKKDFDQKFIWYNIYSNAFREYVESIHTGTSIPHISQKQIADFKISAPSKKEQTIIGEILNSIDDKIDLLHRQNKTLEQLAETLFRQWFVEEAEESWQITTLAEHTEVFRGLSYKGSGLTDAGNGLPMHNLNSVYEFGGYKSDGIKYYKGEYRERHLVYPGDIIVTNTEQGHEHRLIGFPGIVPKSFGEVGLFSQHIYRLVPLKETFLTNQFLYYLLMIPSIREQIIGATNGSTVNMLPIDGLQRPEFKLPPEQKVLEFSNIVADCWKKKESNHNQIETLTKLRDTLLPRLVSGEVRVISNIK